MWHSAASLDRKVPMKIRVANYRLRRPAGSFDRLAVAILGCLLLTHLVHLAFGVVAKSHVVAQGIYALDRHFDVEWAGDSARMEVVSSFRGAMPEFRPRQPIVEVEPKYMTVTVILRGDVAARPLFEELTHRLTKMARERYQLRPDANPISLSELRVTPYAWFKPLDFVAALMLVGSILAWVIYWRPLESTGTPEITRARVGGTTR
jgi:hypothetical protein